MTKNELKSFSDSGVVAFILINVRLLPDGFLASLKPVKSSVNGVKLCG